MAKIKVPVLRFKNPTDAVKNNIRVRPANSVAVYDDPVDTVPAPVVSPDGYSRVPFSSIPQTIGKQGTFDIHVTALDAVGNESDFLEINNQVFDTSPPLAPTDGSLE